MNTTKHILVVEDDAGTRHAMKYVLEAAGYVVGSAANGREALEYLNWFTRPDLILLDLSMPIMDGWQFRHRQQQDPTLASIPVIVTSGESDLPQQAACLFVAGYLPKPVQFDLLLKAICLIDAAHFPKSLLPAG